MVMNPHGQAMELAGPGNFVLNGLTKSKTAALLLCVKTLETTETDAVVSQIPFLRTPLHADFPVMEANAHPVVISQVSARL
jgi:hypothetical protein